MTDKCALEALAAALGPRARRDAPLADYTAMRVGGPADLLVVCESPDALVEAVQLARAHDVPWMVLGGGCNILVADAGVRGLTLVYRASDVSFEGAVVRAEAGALLATLARRTVERGLQGLQWAAGLPGTVGGGVVGNAGAFEGDIAAVLRSATVLEAGGAVEERPAAWFAFDYRSSRVKRSPAAEKAIVLAATFVLTPGDPEGLARRAAEIREWRQTRHPSGATMGSTFKNPPGSHAGYLIEQAGLRGHRIGDAEISAMHGNFFMNVGAASAADVLALIEHARAEVKRQFGFDLELEIERVGAWDEGRGSENEA